MVEFSVRPAPPNPLNKGEPENTILSSLVKGGPENTTLSPPYLWRSLPVGRRGFGGIGSFDAMKELLKSFLIVSNI